MTLIEKDTGSAIFADQSIPNTVRLVVETLFARIKSEQYPPDSRLPAERTLSAELGVARNTVREALDVLEARDVINRRAGSGSFVTYRAVRNGDGIPARSSDIDGSDVSQATSPLELQVMARRSGRRRHHSEASRCLARIRDEQIFDARGQVKNFEANGKADFTCAKIWKELGEIEKAKDAALRAHGDSRKALYSSVIAPVAEGVQDYFVLNDRARDDFPDIGSKVAAGRRSERE